PAYTAAGAGPGRPSRAISTAPGRRKLTAGARGAAVLDRLYLAGRLSERTTDWYAQDRQRNVWYLGEDTAELDARGNVTSTQGTWQAGAHGARAGILMPGTPRLGVTYQQEYRKGQAEDFGQAIGLFRTLDSGKAENALLTKEWSPLEPGTLDHKLYVRGIGTVLEHTEHGGQEHAELISITKTRP